MTWRTGKVTVPASVDAIDLASLKNHLRVSGTSEDAVIDGYRLAAIGHIGKMTGLYLAPQTVEAVTSTWSDLALLPFAPIVSVVVSYRDLTGTFQIFNSGSYTLLDSDPLAPAIELVPGASWPGIYSRSDAIKLTAVCGYSALPDGIRQAILLLAADWYESREDTTAERGVTPMTVPNGINALLANYRLNA